MTDSWCHEVMIKEVWDNLSLAEICEMASEVYGQSIGAKNVADRIVRHAIKIGVVKNDTINRT